MLEYFNDKDKIIESLNSTEEELKKNKALCERKSAVNADCMKQLKDLLSKEKVSSKIEYLGKLLEKFEDQYLFFNQEVDVINEAIIGINYLFGNANEYIELKYDEKFETFNQNYNEIYKAILDHLLESEQTYYEFVGKVVTNKYNDKVYETDFIIEASRVLLISEIQNKVILPYDLNSVQEVISNSEKQFNSMQEIIDENFTLPLSRYSNSYISRFRESVDLIKERTNGTTFDAIKLGFEMAGFRYIHPAVITACKNLEHLDVYVDCLKSNKLEDYPFFKVKFELYPEKARASFVDKYIEGKKAFGLNFFRKRV